MGCPKDTIVNTIGNLNYVEIIGIAKDGVETYNKIVELKPGIVFSKFNFENMNGLDLMKSTKETLQKDLPIFNIIEDKIPDNELRGGTKYNKSQNKFYNNCCYFYMYYVIYYIMLF